MNHIYVPQLVPNIVHNVMKQLCLTVIFWRKLVVLIYGRTISNLVSNPWHSTLFRVMGRLHEWQLPFLTTAESTARLIYCPQWWPGGVTFSSCKGARNSLWPPALISQVAVREQHHEGILLVMSNLISVKPKYRAMNCLDFSPQLQQKHM